MPLSFKGSTDKTAVTIFNDVQFWHGLQWQCRRSGTKCRIAAAAAENYSRSHCVIISAVIGDVIDTWANEWLSCITSELCLKQVVEHFGDAVLAWSYCQPVHLAPHSSFDNYTYTEHRRRWRKWKYLHKSTHIPPCPLVNSFAANPIKTSHFAILV